MTNPKRLLLTFTLTLAVLLTAQAASLAKLSVWLQQQHRQYRHDAQRSGRSMTATPRTVTAFVRTTDQEVLARYGCRIHARQGDIAIASIPLSSLSELAGHPAVTRIEAGPSAHVTMDEVPRIVNATPAYAMSNPGPFTGSGVVMGIVDVGFDLTHPNFYRAPTASIWRQYRVRRFWDQLAPAATTDDGDNPLPVGCEYTTTADILARGHATDGLTQQHGNHTTGIAAGSGYDTPYRGIAYESDLCLVANAITQDTIYIAPEDYDKYTSATDALAFQYVFDYAASEGKPCVVSFSEGYTPYLDEDDELYNAYLNALIGPGRILVASAGNVGLVPTYYEKPAGVEAAGAFIVSYKKQTTYRILTDGTPTIRLLHYADAGIVDESLALDLSEPWDDDATRQQTMDIGGDQCTISTQRYSTSLTNRRTAYLVTIASERSFNHLGSVALVAEGADCTVEVYGSSAAHLASRDADPRWNAGRIGRNVLAPGCLEAPICVGSTSYRQQYTNAAGEVVETNTGDQPGLLSSFSSTGPAMNGLQKPEVVAPGGYVNSSMSSFYYEAHPDDTGNHVAYSTVDGRTYPWANESGTSMSTPVVAGAIAIWLQANPQLTRDDVIGILQRTCRHPEADLDYPNDRYGQGEIDIYRGLLEALHATGIQGLSAHQPQQVRIGMEGDALRLQFRATPPPTLRVRIFALDGRIVWQQQVDNAGTDVLLPLPPMPHAVYAVQTDGDRQTTGSQLIRR